MALSIPDVESTKGHTSPTKDLKSVEGAAGEAMCIEGPATTPQNSVKMAVVNGTHKVVHTEDMASEDPAQSTSCGDSGDIARGLGVAVEVGDSRQEWGNVDSVGG